jgi:hypothetical protein
MAMPFLFPLLAVSILKIFWKIPAFLGKPIFIVSILRTKEQRIIQTKIVPKPTSMSPIQAKNKRTIGF